LITSREGAVLILILSLACLFPIIYGVKSFSYNVGNSLAYTDDMPSMKTVTNMEYYFPPGLASPFYITIDEKDPNHPNGTFRREFFCRR
jgi:uncharacterized membrane protein YdfJ with MMPL/SSD domain